MKLNKKRYLTYLDKILLNSCEVTPPLINQINALYQRKLRDRAKINTELKQGHIGCLGGFFSLHKFF